MSDSDLEKALEEAHAAQNGFADEAMQLVREADEKAEEEVKEKAKKPKKPTLKQLRAEAAILGIKGRSKLNREQLEAAISQVEAQQ